MAISYHLLPTRVGTLLVETQVTREWIDQLDIQDARGQGYDDGANMAGNYRGVQARIQEN